MECVFGLVGDGFVVIAADTSAVNSILVHKSNEDKIMILDSHKLMGASGEAGDRVQFTEFIQKNVSLYQFKNGIPLTTAATANFTRGELATALRKLGHSKESLRVKKHKGKVAFNLNPTYPVIGREACGHWGNDDVVVLLRYYRSPYSVNILLAGYDKETGPSLYFIDYIATLHKVDKAAFGYGAYFALSMMDRHYRSGMSLEEAVDLVDKCILEIRSRLVVSPPNFVIKVVDANGAKQHAWRETIKDTGAAATA